MLLLLLLYDLLVWHRLVNNDNAYCIICKWTLLRPDGWKLRVGNWDPKAETTDAETVEAEAEAEAEIEKPKG